LSYIDAGNALKQRERERERERERVRFKNLFGIAIAFKKWSF
jgi:hypothetical protein